MMKLFLFITDNGDTYDFNDQATFVILCKDETEGRELLAKSDSWGATWQVEKIVELTPEVLWHGMPEVPTIIY